MLSASLSQAIAGATSSGAATGPAAVIATPAFIATAVAGVIGAFASIPKLAAGGAAFGPSLVEVGEYAGARVNPELIGKLSDFKTMIGGNDKQNINVRLAPDVKINLRELSIGLKEVDYENTRRR